jgi:acetyl esterase/lipase
MNELIKTLVCLVALLFSGTAGGAEAGAASVYKTVDGRALKVFVINPPDWRSTDARPAIVFFHGGGWVGGSPSSFNVQAAHLASRGMVAVLVEYRLLEKGASDSPQPCIEDARSAMRWVRGHATELGIDSNRIASAGGSAGGHLAAFVGMMNGFDDPQDDLRVSPKSNAMILFNPVIDNGPDGWGFSRVGERFREFSPFYNVTADAPPAIVFLGTEDQLIPVKTIQDFKAKMEAAGARCDTHFYEGQPHSFFNKEPWRTRTLTEADRFLFGLGWLAN